ncbi:GNAT family N-acetyltransferase [Streptacidiphilus sp. P02-A3a]|uniref:GNAT family N-acetyltransferase n=1 Tax=Streptacidiphilus sp. P02-A3a TaxID=2704468 RepID=UPI0015F9DAC6|nr:GNAT family N-acetyltransferase [Streptacidiphilus sp. P02-A3a]QMU69188.1 GNAT family N-acetyltransferase [Streptacidiphilus sp. P02-A3a]
MTTTLRPLTAEQATPEGGLGRLFAVCVNGRPVGRIAATAHADTGGPRLGELTALVIDPPDRGRGRGTVAALAAEEVLRGWGCARSRVEVPQGPDAPAALRLAEALGYALRARHLLKRLPDSLPELPPGSSGLPLTDQEFDDWYRAEARRVAESEVGEGLSPEQARARAERALRQALPYGPRTPFTVVRQLRAAGRAVGSIWLNTRTDSTPEAPRPPWVYSVQVEPEHRGHGHGRSLMLLAERECLDVGVRRLGLNVYADNAPANALYRALDYRTTRHILFKQL